MLPIPIAPTISLYHTKSSPTIFVPCVLEMLPRLKETEINRGKRLIGICRRSHSSEQFHEHLLFINTLMMVVTLPSPGHEKPATGCQWHIDCGFDGKKEHLVTSISTTTPMLIPVLTATADGREALCSAGAKESQCHQILKGCKWEDKWACLPFQKPALTACNCTVKYKKV